MGALITRRISGIQLLAGMRPPRFYAVVWHSINQDTVVYAPIGLHLVLRVGRAFSMACSVFWRITRNRY